MIAKSGCSVGPENEVPLQEMGSATGLDNGNFSEQRNNKIKTAYYREQAVSGQIISIYNKYI